MKHSDSVILIFAKAPVVGQVNTRLVPHVSAEQAAYLHEEFTHDRLQMCTVTQLCDVQLWCSPDTGHQFFADCKRQYGIQLHTQHGNNLGERMSNAMKRVLGQYNKVIIIGTDAPALSIDMIDAAINELDQRDVVLIPAEDGGYVLLGTSIYHDELLAEVPWGKKHVLATTVSNIDRLNLDYSLLGQCWDVDRPEDLERYLALKM